MVDITIRKRDQHWVIAIDYYCMMYAVQSTGARLSFEQTTFTTSSPIAYTSFQVRDCPLCCQNRFHHRDLLPT